MITPIVGREYIVKHSSGLIHAICLRIDEYNPPKFRHTVFGDVRNERRSTTRYIFKNTLSGREIAIKSRVKIKKELAIPGMS